MLNSCIHSAYWHRFAATIHSPVGLNPENYGIELIANENVLFAENDIDYIDSVSVDHEMLGQGLKKHYITICIISALNTQFRFGLAIRYLRLKSEIIIFWSVYSNPCLSTSFTWFLYKHLRAYPFLKYVPVAILA